jgi:hypothetical protein
MGKYVDAGDIDLDVEEVHLADGTRLTEKKAEELGRRLSEAAARRRGRPSLSGSDRHSPHVSARVPEDVRARLQARAEAEGKPVSAVIREAIEAYV